MHTENNYKLVWLYIQTLNVEMVQGEAQVYNKKIFFFQGLHLVG